MSNTNIYFPVLWATMAILVAGIFIVTSNIHFSQLKISANAAARAKSEQQLLRLKQLRRVLEVLTLILLIGGFSAWQIHSRTEKQLTAERLNQLTPTYDPEKIWTAPDPLLARLDPEARLIAYGRDLVAHTQDYFGAQGLVRPGSINQLNCQSCHLDAGTKPYGNNYFAVQGNYPRMRARSGTVETVAHRVNDCFERSLAGQPLDTASREMKAILAYIRWLSAGVPPGMTPKGSGLASVPLLDRAADPDKGQTVYQAKCTSCHGADGQGLPMPDSPRRYPPLWGDGAYNEAAGLFRLSRFASYVKSNMPFGASHDNPQLSDEEAWDVAAFVNSQPRPAHPFLDKDWPDISKKPFDHPFGPYSDTFPERQHKYGPFGPMVK